MDLIRQGPSVMASTARFTTVFASRTTELAQYMCRKVFSLSFQTLQIQCFSFLVLLPDLLSNPL